MASLILSKAAYRAPPHKFPQQPNFNHVWNYSCLIDDIAACMERVSEDRDYRFVTGESYEQQDAKLAALQELLVVLLIPDAATIEELSRKLDLIERN